MPGKATTEMLPQKIKAWACRFIAEPRTWKGPGSFPSTYLLGEKKHDNEDNILPIMTEPMGLIPYAPVKSSRHRQIPLYFFLLLIFFFFVIIENL